MHNCKYFSIVLDESTDVMDVSQLLVFTQTIKSDVNDYGGFDKLSAVVMDSAPSMTGRCTGFARLLQQSRVNCPVPHCIIHQMGNIIAN